MAQHYVHEIPSPIGRLYAVGDEKTLYSLGFEPVDGERGETVVTRKLAEELKLYFAAQLQEFTLPLSFAGTEFQCKTWKALLDVPYGQTRSYLELAKAVGKAKAFRAVANANGRNRFVIIVPCHRIIASGGGLGGYSAGLDRKRWLLNHESSS